MQQLREPRQNVRIADYSDKIQIVCVRNISRNALQLPPTSSFPFFSSLLLVLFIPSYSLNCPFSRSPLPFNFCILLQPSFFLVPSIPHFLNLSFRFLPFTRYLVSPFFRYYPLSAPTFLPHSTPPLSHPQSLSSFPVPTPSFVLSLSLSPEPSHSCCSWSDLNRHICSAIHSKCAWQLVTFFHAEPCCKNFQIITGCFSLA